MQTQINPSLQALLQTAQMVTPEQGPTVAAKVAQAAQQKMQSQAAPPGIEALLPGVQQQAAQAAQAAQPATQGDVNQLRQMLAQAQQGQGVAQLPGSDVEMAEGGIVGYAGPTGSFVSNLSMEEIERMTPDMRKAYFKELLARRNAPLPTLTAPAAPPAASIRPGVGIAGALAKKLGPLGLLAELFTTSDEDIALLQKAEAARNAVPADARPRGQENYEQLPPVVAPDVAEAVRSGYARFPGSERGRGNTRVAQTPDGSAQRVLAAANVKPSETGLPALMGPPVPSGSERQFAEAIAAQGRMEIPKERTPEQISAERAAYYRSQGIDPNFMQARMERIAAQEKRDQEEAAARAALVKDRGIENLISRLSRVQGPTLFSGLGAAQRGMEPIVAEQRASDERFRALMRERQREADRERAAIEDVQRALADGDIARAEKSRSEALAARNAKAAAEAEMRGRYAPQLLQAETAALDRASRERQHELDRRAQAALRSLPTYEQLLAEKVMKDWMSKNPDKTLADAWDFYREAGKPTDRSVLTYAQAAKIVDERLSELGTQFALNKEEADAAKREKRTPRTLAQMREDLIRKEMAMAGRTAGSAAPASPTTGGAVDKNNPLLK